MKKKIVAILLVIFLAFSAVYAEESWWIGQDISGFEVSGLKHVLSSDINNILYDFRGKQFTDEVCSQMETALKDVPGIETVTTGVTKTPDGKLKVVFSLTEYPYISAITFDGCNRIKKGTISEKVTAIKAGEFYDKSKDSIIDSVNMVIENLYREKGFGAVPVSWELIFNEEDNTVEIRFTIVEGVQTRVTSIKYEGNENVKASALNKVIKTKAKSILGKGYLDSTVVAADESSITAYYNSLGYIDAIVSSRTEEEGKQADGYKNVALIFTIDEGNKWLYGGTEFSGNQVYSDDQIQALLTYKPGQVLNLTAVQNNFSAISDLYYNNGYISCQMNLKENRDDVTMTVSYILDIVEGTQSVIDQVIINGLTKTKLSVMIREVELKSGDVFSKAKLITSAQNLYNTGLLSEIDYDITYGSFENSVNVIFNVKEGEHMDIQFGATFGGNTTGFPISGFLKWGDHDFRGLAQDFDISTTVSPDTQDISVTFGDDWFMGKRWSNSITLSFDHTKYKNQLRLGTGADYNDTDDETSSNYFPFGGEGTYYGPDNDDYSSIPAKDRFSYILWTAAISYNTGYTFIFDTGRLGFNGGVSFSINKADYDPDKYTPYNYNIYRYQQGWKLSNKINLGVQWDGRDYTINTTKGYVLSLNATYAGGVLGGISQYNKVSASASAYKKVAEFEFKEKTKRVMLSGTSTVSAMFDQYYYDKDSKKFVKGFDATTYEKLYIDGMNIGRGFSTVEDLRFMWDNMAELSMPLVDNLLDVQVFASATGTKKSLTKIKNGLDWYFAAGAGVKLKISGFPLGLYIVKNATMLGKNNYDFKWVGGSIFKGSDSTSGFSFVLAISTSLF